MKQIIHKKPLQKASRKAIRDSFSLLIPHLKKARWLGKRNRYRRDTIQILRRDTKSGHSIRGRHLAQYIAASVPLHCADGWSALGRAITCHAQGDYDSARHLSYYAELRAAFALLASEGIGIFSQRHFVVETPEKCHRIGKSHGTHKVVWHALRRWADLERSADLLGGNLIINGLELRGWMDHFMSGPSLQPVGKHWLKVWGMDLQRFSDDQEARNESSYRPTRLIYRTPASVTDTSEFIGALWDLYEPSAPSRFEKLDRYLLRLTLEDTFYGITGKRAEDEHAQFKKHVSGMLSHVITSAQTVDDWERFLTRRTDAADPVVIAEARGDDPVGHPRQHLQVLSRAALLLRIATGACSALLKDVGISRSSLKFWWSDFGSERGIWETAEEPDEFADMWDEVEQAITSIRDWEKDVPAAEKSISRWHRERSYPISVLGGCERIALWGLGL
jgi:hypothetical protein